MEDYNNINKRSKLYKYFLNLFKKSLNNRTELLSKNKLLGKGGQGVVYKYCPKQGVCLNNGVAVKKFYLETYESKYIDNIYDKKALKHGHYIEISSSQLINQLILQGISPNFNLHYTFELNKRNGICDDIYPYNSYHYNEYIENTISYTDWVKQSHPIKTWYNAYFQITVALFALKRYFNMIHLDLHSENILVKKIKKGGYWKYIIDGQVYNVPNEGYIFYIIDFGHAWIPKHFQSWFITEKYDYKKVDRSFDILNLFKSTLDFSKSPIQFKKHIRNIAKLLQKHKFKDVIYDIWGEMYINKDGIGKYKDTFNLDKKLNTKDIPRKLVHLVNF